MGPPMAPILQREGPDPRGRILQGCKRDPCPQGGGDGEEGVLAQEEGRVLL